MAVLVSHKLALVMADSNSLDSCPYPLLITMKHFFDKVPLEPLEIYIQRDDDLRSLNYVWMMGEVSRPLSKEKRSLKFIVFPTVASTLKGFMATMTAKSQMKKAVKRPKMADEDLGFGHFVDEDEDEDGTSAHEETTMVKLQPVSINSKQKSS